MVVKSWADPTLSRDARDTHVRAIVNRADNLRLGVYRSLQHLCELNSRGTEP